jgi:cell division septation protein DedD
VKNKETGEFELVVGNGQIISGFFILVLLLAVFFAMGFIVARAKYQTEPTTSAATTTSSTPAAETKQAPAVAPPITPPDRPADTKTDSTTDSAAKPADAPPAETKQPEPNPVIDAESMKGTYWQVLASKDPSSLRAMVQSLKDLGLPASLSPGPNEMTRVLVGPYSDNTTLAKVKTQLEQAGLNPVKRVQ